MIDFVRNHKVKSFKDILGQENVTRFLKNSIYKSYYFPLYLFSGMRGTGKTSTARIFAYSYFCQKRSAFCALQGSIDLPCGECASCIMSFAGRNPNIIEMDAASHTGVDNMRALIESSYLLPIESDKKFYIIDEAHMLSKSAFNACLKIMEEPPKHVHFIMATTEPQKIIETIRSRSIHLHFKSIHHSILSAYLKKILRYDEVEIDDQAAELVAHIAEGSIRDALNILTKLCITFGKHITYELVFNEHINASKNDIITLIDAFIAYDKNLFLQKYNILRTVEYIDKKNVFTIMLEHVLDLYYKHIQKNESCSSLEKLITLLYEHENLFLQSSNPLGLILVWFESICLNAKSNQQTLNHHHNNTQLPNTLCNDHNKTMHNDTALSNNCTNQTPNSHDTPNKNFIENFLTEIMLVDKPIGAILKTTSPLYNHEKKMLTCTLAPHVAFYKDIIDQKKNIIKQIGAKILKTDDFNIEYVIQNIEIKNNIVVNKNVTEAQQREQYSKNSLQSSAIQASSLNNIPQEQFISKNNGQAWGNRFNQQKKTIDKKNFPPSSSAYHIITLLPGTTYENNHMNNKHKSL